MVLSHPAARRLAAFVARRLVGAGMCLIVLGCRLLPAEHPYRVFTEARAAAQIDTGWRRRVIRPLGGAPGDRGSRGRRRLVAAAVAVATAALLELSL